MVKQSKCVSLKYGLDKGFDDDNGDVNGEESHFKDH